MVDIFDSKACQNGGSGSVCNLGFGLKHKNDLFTVYPIP